MEEITFMVSPEEAVALEKKTSQPTLRDQFAMAALTGLIGRGADTYVGYSKSSYLIADAMLAARVKK